MMQKVTLFCVTFKILSRNAWILDELVWNNKKGWSHEWFICTTCQESVVHFLCVTIIMILADNVF